jgi:hypothetical protein
MMNVAPPNETSRESSSRFQYYSDMPLPTEDSPIYTSPPFEDSMSESNLTEMQMDSSPFNFPISPNSIITPSYFN